MEPLTLALAAGAYVAAGLAKNTADAVISAAYKKVETYIVGKLGRKVRIEDLDTETVRRSGLTDDPILTEFGNEVLSRTPALRRARLVSTVLKGARVLWVDDQPAGNRSECRMLATLGADVTQVPSSQDAIAALSGQSWDVLLSDVARDGVSDAGIQMLGRLPRNSPPVIFYVGHLDKSLPIPLGAFGVADQPEPLLHLVLDVLERRKL